MTELELAEALGAGTLDPAAFTHADHLRVAWALLGPLGLGFADAYARLRRGLISIAERAGQPAKYSETLTLAWLALIHEELERTGERADFAAFRLAAGERLTRATLVDRYGADSLRHPAARTGLILPKAAA